ncbi:hypothetical protein BDY17DRAFT_289027 [Neohortaea acidophila]|uniref:Uncharacterized protein n=1 Tax=Neohortaea acidophila TaxID=245834 RepID=A0A6A6Q669_9PEZI|nr:uncharacterized protein BDY17DRAFT_289027 [Neohortaea acidophila]KAF2487474.1 hypothetical protein BDY17DRAFT_289027 [Neohortaea acidophila]
MTAQSSAKSDTASADPEEQAKAQDALETTEKTEQAPERDAASEESLIVTWDGPDDPENPLNFSLRYKCWITAITSLMTFSVSFGSAIWAAATEAIGFATGKSLLRQALLNSATAVERSCVD